MAYSYAKCSGGGHLCSGGWTFFAITPFCRLRSIYFTHSHILATFTSRKNNFTPTGSDFFSSGQGFWGLLGMECT